MTLEAMRKADAIIFDCDGVLVDVSESYDATIRQTVAHTLASMHAENSLVIDKHIIDAFKASGGFNDEVDLAYAAIICIIAANKTNQNPAEFVINACRTIDSTGIAAIEQYVLEKADISDVIAELAYPGKRNSSTIHDTFNQIFYGGSLYKKLFNKEPTLQNPGKIDSDILLVDAPTIRTLCSIFGKKPPVVTGRGRASFEYTVCEPLRSEFDTRNSVFLEDEPRSMAKPNPDSLISTMQRISAGEAIYVGDSIEDLIMSKRATEGGYPTIFCGITGTSSDPHAKAELLEGAGAHALFPTVNELAKILNQ